MDQMSLLKVVWLSFVSVTLPFQSTEVYFTCWDVHWQQLDVDNQKLMLMMICRSQRSKSIRVPFFELSLFAYSKVIWLLMSRFEVESV